MLRVFLQDTGLLEDRYGLDLCNYVVHSLLSGEKEEEKRKEKSNVGGSEAEDLGG